MLRAVSLHQPEADLVASGKLTVFTKRWRTPMRGRIGVHAADTPGSGLATQAIVAVATLAEVVEFSEARVPRRERARLAEVEGTPRRWLYVLADVERVEPVECRGSGSGAWTVPEDVEAALYPSSTNSSSSS